MGKMRGNKRHKKDNSTVQPLKMSLNIKETEGPVTQSSIYPVNAMDGASTMADHLSLIKLNSDDILDVDSKNQSSDEPYKFLQGLNSDNLLKLSQQSVVMRMINEEVNMKPNINVLPTLEEHDYGGYNFHIKPIELKMRKKNTPVYSEVLNKLYVKINNKTAIDIRLKAKLPLQPLRVRVFMVFAKDISEPVLRCQNHICIDRNENVYIKESLIRCDQPDAVYCGNASGKNIKDRYSLLIPLNACIQPESNELRQQLLLSFSCNNSCLGRKETCAIFLLENLSGEILGQRLMHIKVCACNKRDKSADERLFMNFARKRKTSNSSGSRENSKMPRYSVERSLQLAADDTIDVNDSSVSADEISDYDSGNDIGTDENNIDVRRELNGKYLLSIRYGDREELLEALEQLYANAKRKEVFGSCTEKLLDQLNTAPVESKHFKRAYDKASAMMNESDP